jgi:GNAT superfamily N-acetyltransferase
VRDPSFPDAGARAATADVLAKSRAAAGARIHLASPADVPFIVAAIAAESRHGHFSCDCDRPDVLRGLWHQIRSVVAEGRTPMPDARDGAAGRGFVVQSGEVNAGFAILVEQAPGSWPERIELFAMVTDPVFRGQGLGRHLVRTLVRNSGSARVHARCAAASGAMGALLQSCGFVPVARSPEGTTTFEIHRPAWAQAPG